MRTKKSLSRLTGLNERNEALDRAVAILQNARELLRSLEEFDRKTPVISQKEPDAHRVVQG